VVKSLVRPFLKYPPGHNIADTWMRDIGIAIIVSLTAAGLGVSPTRGHATTEPSAAYFVALALKKKGFQRLKEQRVNPIYLEQGKLAARFEASMPAVAF